MLLFSVLTGNKTRLTAMQADFPVKGVQGIDEDIDTLAY
jgi:hypothetical protein